MTDDLVINFKTGTLWCDGKDTGVSLADVAATKEFQEFLRDEIDKEILAKLVDKVKEKK